MALPAQHIIGILEAGLDEAGRGCLAGPVVAAAVILPDGFSHELLNDSKKLTAKQRDSLAEMIKEKAHAWAVAEVSHSRIDEINILNASFEAMHIAVKGLSILPQALLIDGNRFKAFAGIPHTCMVKGDGRFQNIAAASILAKTARDRIMEDLHDAYPHYGWRQNKGYPTEQHRKAIQDHGLTPWHRRSFNLLPQPTLF